MMKIVGALLLCMCTFTFADNEEKRPGPWKKNGEPSMSMCMQDSPFLFQGAELCAIVPSACELDRERRLGATTPASLHLIPECDPNGDYSAKQCFTGIDWCVCYRRNGENINTPSKKIKACDCVRARDDAITNEDDYKPRCTPEGYYRPKQCKGRECWCVDKDGNQKTDPTTGDVNC